MLYHQNLSYIVFQIVVMEIKIVYMIRIVMHYVIQQQILVK
jgi:hypothetical protein